MTDKTDQQGAIEKLEALVKAMPQFTAEEQTLVREVLEAYRGWLVLGKALKLLIVLLAGISATVVASGHIKTALKAWLS
jgi:hypothetical protein